MCLPAFQSVSPVLLRSHLLVVSVLQVKAGTLPRLIGGRSVFVRKRLRAHVPRGVVPLEHFPCIETTPLHLTMQCRAANPDIRRRIGAI